MLTTKYTNNVVSDTDKEGNVLPVTEAELREDHAATRDTDELIAELTAQATPLRRQIAKLEDAARHVTNEALLADARALISKLRLELCRLVSLATHGAYTPEEVSEWFAAAMRRGGKFPRLRGDIFDDLARIQQVPVLPLRESFVDYLETTPGIDYSSIVRAAHDHLVQMEQADGEEYGSEAWEEGHESKRPDLQFQTHLGMRERNDGKGGLSFKTFISYERAVAISRAIGLNPIQAGV